VPAGSTATLTCPWSASRPSGGPGRRPPAAATWVRILYRTHILPPHRTGDSSSGLDLHVTGAAQRRTAACPATARMPDAPRAGRMRETRNVPVFVPNILPCQRTHRRSPSYPCCRRRSGSVGENRGSRRRDNRSAAQDAGRVRTPARPAKASQNAGGPWHAVRRTLAAIRSETPARRLRLSRRSRRHRARRSAGRASAAASTGGNRAQRIRRTEGRRPDLRAVPARRRRAGGNAPQ
jgi:hypothetical protein